MTSPLQILFAIPALDTGGPDRVLFELLCSLDRSRFVPSLMVTEPGGRYLAQLPDDVHVEALGTGNGWRDRYPIVRALRVIHRRKPDIVFATLRMALTLGMVSWAFPRKTRLVLRQANDVSADFAALIEQSLVKHRLARQMTLASLKRADAVVCQSEAMKRDLSDLLGDSEHLHVIGNPIDLERVAKLSTVTRELRGDPALISVGRLMPQKGYDVLLPALALIRDRHPGVHLTILGDGPDRDDLEQQAHRLGIAGNVTFAGFEPNPIPIVRAADLFVLASRYEGFPNAALEALACGTPVVLTDCPGANAEILEPGINGRLATAVEPAAMARALEAAIAERAQYDRARITASCAARFDARRIVAKYEQVFRSVAVS